jgi:hypothetical protein
MAMSLKNYSPQVMAIACRTCGKGVRERCVPRTGNPVGARPYPAHAARVNDANEIQELATVLDLTYEEAIVIWKGAFRVYGPERQP